MDQLTLDGGAESLAQVRAEQHRQGLSDVQREVIRLMRERGGELRTVEAGVVVHRARAAARTAAGRFLAVPMAHRGCGHGARSGDFRGGGIACCAYCAPDGLEMMNRLMARGIVERTERRGVWRLLTS